MSATDWAAGAQGAGQYADVNGINLYYETNGAGRPLILLHGGLGSGEMFGPILPALGEHLGVDGAPTDVRRDGDEPSDDLGMANRRLESHAAAKRVAHDVGLVEPEMPDECRDVVGHQLDAERPVDVGGSAVAL